MAYCSRILRIFANACRSSRTFLISAIWRSTSRFPALLRKRLGLIPFSVGQDVIVAPDAPRTGRELQVFHVASAFLQEASVNAADCDVHFDFYDRAQECSQGHGGTLWIVTSAVLVRMPNLSWRNINSCWTPSMAVNCHSSCQWMSWGWP